MLPCTLAPIRPSQNSLVRANNLLQKVRPRVRIALAGEDQGLLQKQEHFTRELSVESLPSLLGGDLQHSESRDRLD